MVDEVEQPERTARRASDLVEASVLPPERAAEVERVSRELAVAVTPEMLRLIDPDDPDDPIARQFVPSAAELTVQPVERADPIADALHSPLKGIVHRYPDRALLTPVHVCPVYCRFCFRREKVGRGGEALTAAELADALDYLRSHRELREVILTGGDPLVLAPRRLQGIVERLRAIEHLELLRVHTRVPVVAPERVTAELVQALRGGAPLWVVIHSNHPRELTPAARAACARLADAGLPLLAQTVLLSGVNDDAETLEALFRGFLRNRIKPYYLHHGDLARGTGHLRTTIAHGQRLLRALRGRVSGLALPAYVLDLPGGWGKVPVGPVYLEETGEPGRYRVTDPWGSEHGYPPREGGEG